MDSLASGSEGKDEREEEESEEVEGEAEPALEEDSEKEAGEEHGTAAAETVEEDAPEHSGSASGDLSMASDDAALPVPVPASASMPSSQAAVEAEEEGGSAHPEVTAPHVTDATTTDAAITKKPLKSNIRSGATATTASSISAKFFGLSGGVTEKRPAKVVKLSIWLFLEVCLWLMF